MRTPEELGAPTYPQNWDSRKQIVGVLPLWAPRAMFHSYLPWEGWTAACPRHLALVQLPGDLGYVLAR